MKKLVILLALALMGSLLVFYGGQTAKALHPTGPVAYWSFDDGVSPTADVTGHGHDGTVVGAGAVFGGGNIAPIPGSLDAIDFDGGGTNADPDYVSVVDAATLTPSGSAVTISAWIYPESGSLSGYVMVAGKWNDGNREYELFLVNGKIQFFAWNGAISYAVSSTTLSAGSWYHVAGVWDGSDLQVYLNGGADGASTAFTGTIPDTGAILTIGAQHWNGIWWRFFEGVIDEVQIYDRALSGDEIISLYLTGDTGTLFVDRDGEVGLGSSVDCDGTGVFVYDVIQDAVDAAGSGDTVLLCDHAPFGQSVVFGPEDSGITLGAVEGASPVLDGTGPADSGATIDPNAGIKLLDGVIDVEIISLELTGFSGSRGSGISAWDVSTSNIKIRDNDIHDNAWNGVLVGSEGGFVHSSWMVRDNLVEDNGFVGIELTNCDSCTIIKNTVTHNGFADIVVQARNTVAGSGLVAIDGVSVLHNTVGSSLIGIYVLSFTGHPTAFTPITVASTLLTSVNVQHNTVTDSTVSQIRFWAFNDAATAENGRISHNEINCPGSGSPYGIQILERGSGIERGTVSNVKVVGNSFNIHCSSDILDEGENTKIKP